MSALATAGYEVKGFGVVLDEGSKKSVLSFKGDIKDIRALSLRTTFLPRKLRALLALCEIFLRSIRHRPQVIHCHDTVILPIGVALKIFTGARLVYDAHELESDRNSITRLGSWLTLHVERFLWRFVDALIVVSPSIDSWYQAKLGPKLSAIIFNSPCISNNTLRGNDYLRQKFAIPPDQKIFIYVGILGVGRGIDLIIDLFARPTITSHVVFLGYGDFADKLRQLGVDHRNIHVHCPVPHSEVVSIVKSADIGLCLIQNVSLSDYYCLPNKLFEYCFAGVPVLASDFPDIRSVVTEFGVGLCCSLNSDALEEAIHSLKITDKNFQFSDLAPLSWQTQEKKLIDLYQLLLGK